MAKLVIKSTSRTSSLKQGTVIRIFDRVGVIYDNNSMSGIIRIRMKNGDVFPFTPKYFSEPVECEILEKHDPVVFRNNSYYFKENV